VFETEDEQAAFDKEVELIALYGRRDLGRGALFNLTDGGEGASGSIRTAEQKKLIGRFTKQYWQDPAYREKIVEAQIKVQNTPEALESKSTHSKKMWETKADVVAAAIKTARNTDASKAKTSAQATAQWADPEYAAKQTANNKEIANRAEVKEAKKAAAKALWADPVWKAKMMEARKQKRIQKLLDTPTD
jgi:hypothetical protein